MTVMTIDEFKQSDEFAEYIGERDYFEDLSEQKQGQVVSSAASIKGVVLEPEGGFDKSDFGDEYADGEELEGDTGFGIDMAELPEWESAMLEAWESTVATEDTDRQLLQTSTEVPAFVQDRIRDSIMDGNVFSDIDSISGDMMQLRNYLTESLTSDGGWTIDGVADQLMQLDGVDTRDKAEVIARTETASVLNSAREDGYKEQGLEDSKFYWSNPLTDRTTEACEWLTKKTNPFKGGDPVSLERLKELIEEAPEHDDEMQDDLARPENYVIHPNERSSWVRMPGT